MHLVEVLKGRWQFRQYRLRVTQVHAGHVFTFEGVHETLGRAVALRLQKGVLMGFRPSVRAGAFVSAATYAPPLSLRSPNTWPCGTVLPEPNRLSTASAERHYTLVIPPLIFRLFGARPRWPAAKPGLLDHTELPAKGWR